MERLNQVFNDTERNSDDDFLIRVINTVLENNQYNNYQQLSYFRDLTKLIFDLLNEYPHKRLDIKEMINDVQSQNFSTSNNYINSRNFIPLIKKYNTLIHNTSGNAIDYKSLYVMCFGRLLFECIYVDHIYYKSPQYAYEIAMGTSTQWSIFLDAIQNDDADIL